MSEDLRAQPWFRAFQKVMAELPGLVSDRLELLALELQRAGRSLVQIMALVMATAILGTAAWLALCSGLGLTLVAQGLSWPLALLAVLLVNLALAWAAVSRVRRLLASLGLPATRRHLVFGAKAGTAAGVALNRQPFTNRSEGRP
ncbi:phage holin family protein [Rhodoferax sp.]|uniref:phage holin family protein n=1 Tax=Rhodoferax sp. TaxID=50421 RepID=UPI0025CFA504|nr:phage holin family protein [Rhodoferax sp.]